ncbi:segregation and condensation protein A [Erysipelotrichaceae bacterium]|nr:segregation and condensation protein A [Erysipelotrichaceae bacterium]
MTIHKSEQPYIIHSEQFEGPLDILLHLIQKSKVDIMDISISDITEQYITYLDSLKNLNLEIASDYLLMSARLIEMKSRLLLPKNKNLEDADEIDPREELIQRLLEYKKYKDVISDFREFEDIRQQVYSKPFSDVSEWVQNQTLLTDTHKPNVYQLVKVFEKMYQRKRQTTFQAVTIERQEITMEEQILVIETKLKKQEKTLLSEILFEKEIPYIVTTFLALLQLARTQKIHILQVENFDDIIMELRK